MANLEYSICGKRIKACPLCGTRVQMKVYGKLALFAPGEDLPVFNVRCIIKCPTDNLKLDLGRNGWADAEGKTGSEQEAMLKTIAESYASEVLEIWNRRSEDGGDQ